MAKKICCPFYTSHTKLFVICENQHFESFDNNIKCREFVAKYCGHIKGWECCKHAKELNALYELE